MDKYLSDDACESRLFADYMKHGMLIVAVDFDNTIYDFHNDGLVFNDVIALIKRCNVFEFPVIVFTANNDEYLIGNYCRSIGIEIQGINTNHLQQFAR